VPRKSPRREKSEVIGLVGVGLDNQDGHKRITQGKKFLLLGGSAETHERMVNTVVEVHEELDKRGQELEDITPEELAKLLREASF
jgi:hypothetical protein